PDIQPARAEVWINGFRLSALDMPQGWDKDGTTWRRKVTLPYGKLRAGANTVTLQVYNRAGARAEAARPLACDRPPPDQPRLVGMAVGIDDYNAAAKAVGGGRALGDLDYAGLDAKAMAKAWESQKYF